MLTIISPAKSLDFENPAPTKKYTKANFLDQAEELNSILQKMSTEDISAFMGISKKLSQLNYERIQTWHRPFELSNAKQAIFAFTGDVYTGLDAKSLSETELDKAQKDLCILSGMYGVLRPLDLIQAYRLEMGKKLENKQGNDLYKFWNNIITEKINQIIDQEDKKHIINLASNEYFKVIKKKEIKAEIITPIFKDLKNGKYKIISFYAKKARGMMLRFILQNDIKNPEELIAFCDDGYNYNSELSSKNELVFTRDH